MYLLNNILTLKMYTSKPNPRRNSAYRPFSKPDMKVISTFFSSNKKKCDVVCILGSLLDFTSHLTAGMECTQHHLAMTETQYEGVLAWIFTFRHFSSFYRSCSAQLNSPHPLPSKPLALNSWSNARHTALLFCVF